MCVIARQFFDSTRGCSVSQQRRCLLLALLTSGEPRTHNKCHQHVGSSGFKGAEKNIILISGSKPAGPCQGLLVMSCQQPKTINTISSRKRLFFFFYQSKASVDGHEQGQQQYYYILLTVINNLVLMAHTAVSN